MNALPVEKAQIDPPPPARACPVCASWSHGAPIVAAGKRDLFGAPLTLVRCSLCGTVFQPRVPDPAQLAAWYDYMGHEPLNMTSTPLVARRLDRMLAPLERYRRTGRLLEVGAGGGLLVEAALRHGWETHATEISPSCATRLRGMLGPRLHQGELTDSRFEEGSFDVVVMLEVVEHLVDPASYLAIARRLLRPGGNLMLSTPNYCGASGRLRGNRWRVVCGEHLNYFNAHALKTLVAGAGFEAIAVTRTSLDLRSLNDWLRSYGPIPAVRADGPSRSRADETTARGSPPSDARAHLKAMLTDRCIEVLNAGLGTLRLGDTLKVSAIATPPRGRS